MSKFVAGVCGAAVFIASLGVAGLAVGNNLAGTQAQIAATAQANMVNRTFKTDRAGGMKLGGGQTIVTQRSAVDSTSIAIRIPSQAAQSQIKTGNVARRPVACESPASVLSEIAQHLESGRCVT